MSKNTIRIRTTPDGGDTYIKAQIDQDFDFIEILSLKISQDKVYQKFCSDYGVVVGRVYANSGFGIPNARVSIFIPIDTEDKNNPEIAKLYPFETITDKDTNGVRYNLLPNESDSNDSCYTPVGTFSSKREILDNDKLLSIYTKYYKYTTVTNKAGDFMLFGVPIGNHMLHVDVDISNIGIVSQRPYDLIAQGASDKLFDTSTKFKSSTNLDSLPQVKSINTGVNVLPFWGDTDNFEIGISRVDVDINYDIKPAAIFMGSIFGDSEKNSVNKNCRPRKKMGNICETNTGAGSVEMIRKTDDGGIEEYNVEGGRVIDDDGVWAYQVPMNLDYMVTDEFGNLILTDDKSKGVPTRTRVRFRVGLDEKGDVGRLRTRAKFLIPHNPEKFEDRDFSFDKTTKDSSFVDLYWNKIYSIKSFIPRIQNSGGVDNRNTLGMKDLAKCSGEKNPFPYNRMDTNVSPIFSVICILVSIIATFVSVLNGILCFIHNIKILGNRIFGSVEPIPLTCPSDPKIDYIVGAKKCNGVKTDVFVDCLSAVLAEDLDVFELDFYNDWINGSLYAYSLKYKKKRKGSEKFCEYDCTDFPDSIDKNNCNSKLLLDSCTGNGVDPSDDSHQKTYNTVSLSDGFISDYNEVLYYSPIVHNGKFRLFATDIISLGSIFDCDWQGMPKIQQYLLPTSFKLPPVITESEDDGSVVCGMTNVTNRTSGNGVFFTIDCSGVRLDEGNCSNIRKICEIGNDLPGADCTVGLNDIYDVTDPVDVINSTNKFVRNMFYGLNISGTSVFSLTDGFIPVTGGSGGLITPIVNDPSGGLLFYGLNLNGNNIGFTGDINTPVFGTSFNVSDSRFKQVNGIAYDKFRSYYPAASGTYQQPLGGSFFFYFGLHPGKTALDKMNSRFFTKCTKTVSDDFIIESSFTPVTAENASDGSITFNFIGGTEPYTYTWSGINYTSGPTVGSSGMISGLRNGEYKIVVSDLKGNSQEKTVTVGLPGALACYLQINKNATTQTSNDGQILIYAIVGGKAPYTLTYTKPDNTSKVMSIKQGDILNEVPFGINTFVFTDSTNPVQNYTTTVDVKAPDKLFCNVIVTDSKCGEDGNGHIDVSISGGTKPYTVKSTDFDGNEIDVSSDYSLSAGIYTIIITDSGMQTLVKTVTVKTNSKPIAVISTKRLPTGIYTHTVSARSGYGIPPYTGTGIIVDHNKTLTASITDSTGCESEAVTG
jgi:hypothetical protein